MRVLLWHGWLLEGSGSNVYTARTAQTLRRLGHDVLLLCQEVHPELVPYVDAYGTVDADGVHLDASGPGESGQSRVTLLRPEIGPILPVFVWDEYEGFDVRRFVDLGDADLDRYLAANVAGLRAAAAWHRPEASIVAHAVPGAVIARRALGERRYVAKVHGSDLEYAIRLQDRYLDLAREGLEGATAVVGASADVLARAAELVPSLAGRTTVVPPGVDVATFRPASRRDALRRTAALLDEDPEAGRGRPVSLDRLVADALDRRDGEALDQLPLRYDQASPDPDAAMRIRALMAEPALVGYLGKLIPQKGVHHLLGALAVAEARSPALIIGFGTSREWLHALLAALDRGDPSAVRWVAERGGLDPGLTDDQVRRAEGLGGLVTFTGRLDHRYAGVVAALDVLVVPSVLDEAFGMVAAEGASAGALPLVARHSGLAEVAGLLEREVGEPEMFSFAPGEGVVPRIAAGIDRLLAVDAGRRAELVQAVGGVVAREWTWDQTVRRLLEAAG